MTEKGLKYLSDIKQAIKLIEDFTSSITTYNEYWEDKKHKVLLNGNWEL